VGVDEGPPDAAVRGQGLPTLKTQSQDSMRALASLSLRLSIGEGVGFQVKCAILRCEEGRCSTRDAPIVPEILRRSCRKSHKPCADPHGWGDRWGGLARGTQAWEDPTRPIKEHAVSDRRRVCGTIRAALMDNGATHLESYTVACRWP